MGLVAVNSSRYLLDTVILIDHLRGMTKATRWLEGLKPGEAMLSVITCAEVLVGSSPDEEDSIQLLLNQYECLTLTPKVADAAARLRREHKWKLPDAFQAALALEYRLKLITRNTKDFSPKIYPFVMVPYEF